MRFQISKIWGGLVLGYTFLFCTGSAQAKTYQFEQLTVLGQAQETEVFKNPASVSVVDQNMLSKSSGQSVAQYLRNVPGVQIMEEGVERISIRGEDSRRVAILIDGQKLTDHTNYGQPLLIDPDSIERIEVLRGSSSVVSGSRAIGGVINIVTKKGAKKPLEFSTRASYFSATQGYRASTSLSGSQAGFDYRLGVSRAEQNDRSTPKGRLKPSGTDDRNISAHLGYANGPHYLAVKAQRFDVAATVYLEQDDFMIDLPKRELNKIGLFYQGDQLNEWLDRLKIDVYEQKTDREFHNNVTQRLPVMTVNVDSLSDDEQITRGMNMLAELSLFAEHSTVLGMEYEQDRIKTNKHSITSMSFNTPFPPGSVTQRLGYEDARIDTASFFAQHSIPLIPDLTATLGARYYHVKAQHDKSRLNHMDQSRKSNSDNHILGAANLVWQANDALVLRTNISQGYIYPTLGQLFLTTTAGGQTIAGNADLKPETATTFEVGGRYQANELILDATVFYSRSKDYIDSVLTSRNVGTYQNIDKAKSFGLELTVEKSFDSSGLTPYVTATLMRRQLTTPTYRSYDSGTPSAFAQLGLRHTSYWGHLEREVDMYMQGATAARYTSKNSTEAARTDRYATLNLRLSMLSDNKNSVGIELNNLTNTTYRPLSEQLYGAKRSANLFVSYTF